jgi:predicted SAM-dependent methyltransferase
LNLGCGPLREPGEIGVDLDPKAAGCDIAANLLNLPFADGTVDQARLSHVLEHFPYRMAPTVLLEVARILKPGGKLIVGVPDMLGTCRAWADVHETTDATKAQRLSSKQIVMRHIYGGQFHDGQEHLSGWDEETLMDLLEACGYREIAVRMDIERGDVIDSLRAEAVKP